MIQLVAQECAGAGLTRNLFLTLIPLQHHGADWALVMWILEYLNEPTPLPSECAARHHRN